MNEIENQIKKLQQDIREYEATRLKRMKLMRRVDIAISIMMLFIIVGQFAFLYTAFTMREEPDYMKTIKSIQLEAPNSCEIQTQCHI